MFGANLTLVLGRRAQNPSFSLGLSQTSVDPDITPTAARAGKLSRGGTSASSLLLLPHSHLPELLRGRLLFATEYVHLLQRAALPQLWFSRR
ncbi:hypothetical protein E2320_022246 [Naja naja]|nr:hypothetical protein E2320_022246 [Naja naja]